MKFYADDDNNVEFHILNMKNATLKSCNNKTSPRVRLDLLDRLHKSLGIEIMTITWAIRQHKLYE